MISIKDEVIKYIVDTIKKEKNVDAIETTILINDDEDFSIRNMLKSGAFPIVIYYRYFDDEKCEPSYTQYININREKYNKKVRVIKLKYLNQCSSQETE